METNNRCPYVDYCDREVSQDDELATLALIGRLADHGTSVSVHKFKKLHGLELYEARTDQHRFLGFIGRAQPDGRSTLVLVNAFKKQQDRTRPQQIDRALRLKAVYEEGQGDE